MRTWTGFAAVACIAIGSEMGAQASDSAVFRAGQWGNEFTAGTGFSGVAFLRFRSPVRAWVLDAGGNIRTGETEELNSRREISGGSFQLQLGHRWYRPIVPRVYQHLTLGALGSYSREDQKVSPLVSTRLTGFEFGVFGAVGANWMVTPHLSLGAAWQLNATHTSTRNELLSVVAPGCTPTCPDPRDDRSRTTSLGAGGVSLRLALYY